MPKRILQGVVTSTANTQTITVSVERRFKHPVLQKTIRKSKKYRAHGRNLGRRVASPDTSKHTLVKGTMSVWSVGKDSFRRAPSQDT